MMKWRCVGISVSLLVLPYLAIPQYPSEYRLTPNSGEQVECAVAISPVNSNHVIVAWNDYSEGGRSDLGWKISLNNGVSWSDSGMFDDGIDPSCAFDRYGNVAVAYYKWETWGGRIVVAVSSDSGRNWDTTNVYGGKVDKPLLSIDNSGGSLDGRVYVTWMVWHDVSQADYRPDSILLSYASSADGGFSSPHIIEVLPKTPHKSIGWPMTAIGNCSTMYIAWCRIIAYGNIAQDYDSSAVVIAVSTDGGLNLSGPDTVTKYTHESVSAYFGGGDKARVIPIPTLAADQSDGVFITLWNRISYGNSNKRIKFYRSIGGDPTVWESLGAIGELGGVQFFPGVSVNQDAVYVTYMRSPAEYPGSGDSVACYLIHSSDRGSDFSNPVRISGFSMPSYASKHHEYNWLSASRDRLFAAWTDYRNTNSDIYVSGFQLSRMSSSGTATGFGSTPKTLYSDSTERWHSIYVDNGKIHHTYSSNDGFSWDTDTIISASLGGVTSSSNPALVEGTDGALHVVFASTGNGIYHTRKAINGSWSSPVKIYNASSATYPSLILSHDTGHVVFVKYLSAGEAGEAPGGTYKVYYGTFDVDISDTLNVKKEVYSSSVSPVTGISLAQLSSGQLHAVWSRGNEIYHSSGSGTSWSTPSNISSNSGASVNPSIATIGGSAVRVVWQDNTSGNNEILSKLYNGSWNSTENLSDNSGSSEYPTIMYSDFYGGMPFVSWSDNTNGNYDIWYQMYGMSSVALRSSLATSRHAAVTERLKGDTTRFLFVWTEGSSSPYAIASAYADGPDLGGNARFRDVVAEGEQLPAFELSPNYPNPFNPTTRIRYSLLDDNLVTIAVYNTVGQEITKIVEGPQSAGQHEVVFDASGLPSGVYFYRIRAGLNSVVRKMLHMK